MKTKKISIAIKSKLPPSKFVRLYVVKWTFQSCSEEWYLSLSAIKADTDQGHNFVNCLPPQRVQCHNRYLEYLSFPTAPIKSPLSQTNELKETYHRVCKFPNGTRQLCCSAHLSNDCRILCRKYGRSSRRWFPQRILQHSTPCWRMNIVAF